MIARSRGTASTPPDLPLSKGEECQRPFHPPCFPSPRRGRVGGEGRAGGRGANGHPRRRMKLADEQYEKYAG